MSYSLIGETFENRFVSIESTHFDINPLLGPLADNGGPTQTHALLPGSQALEAGVSVGYDQRGLAAPIDLPGIPNAVGGDGRDIGAYEAQIAPIADFDSDGDVDLFDLMRLQRGFGAMRDAVLADGNSDDDGDVDASDQAAWEISFEQGAVTVEALAEPVPELPPVEQPYFPEQEPITPESALVNAIIHSEATVQRESFAAMDAPVSEEAVDAALQTLRVVWPVQSGVLDSAAVADLVEVPLDSEGEESVDGFEEELTFSGWFLG
ncbi:MAG: choice-of-anchor Q domain-containing protein [Planctomycetota bacterium]